MNCKPGDIALAVPPSFDAGRAFTCVEAIAAPVPETVGLGIAMPSNYPLWRVDRDATWVAASKRAERRLPFIPDRYLVPINPRSDGCVDEEGADAPATLEA